MGTRKNHSSYNWLINLVQWFKREDLERELFSKYA